MALKREEVLDLLKNAGIPIVPELSDKSIMQIVQEALNQKDSKNVRIR